MGDFSRSTFDRVKHYVGIRLQQGVPLVDADWNELEDIRRFEVQAFLKWFVGDGVPAGNDGFRIAAAAGGGVGTLRLTPAATGQVSSSVLVDVTTSTAAAALGFTAVNQQASRALAPARLTGDTAQPFALAAGMTLVVSANGAAAETVTFQAAGFANIGAATAAEVVAAVNAAVTRVVASAGTGDDFVIFGGDGTPEGAGRCLTGGRDAVHEGRLAYASQPLHANSALAAAWGVPVIPALAAPATGSRSDLVYLDVWDREVTAAEDDTLVDPLIGVETCVRLRREWAVRVRPGASQPPVIGDADFTAGHSYLQLAQLNRQSGTTAIQLTALSDLRPRNLLMPPSTLIDDVLGTSADSYRKGLNRPRVSLRDAINALLSGKLPSSPEISVSRSPTLDQMNKASVVDVAGGLVAVWQSQRVDGNTQIFAARMDPSRFDPAHLELAFTTAPAITSGVAHTEPSAVALPNGDLLVAYQNGLVDAPGTDVLMRQGPLFDLGAKPEKAVAATPSPTADQTVRAALAGPNREQVVFLTYQSQSTTSQRQWFYQRYLHADADRAFLDANPVALSTADLTKRDLHAASAGGMVWIAYADGANVQVLRFNPIPTGTNRSDPPIIDFKQAIPAANAQDVFVLAISATDAAVCYDDGVGLSVATPSSTGVWTTTRLPDSVLEDGQPTLVRDADGTLYLISTKLVTSGTTDIMLRRRISAAEWTSPQRLVTNALSNQRPHPFLVPGMGLWLLWFGNRTGDFDIYAKQIITTI